MRIESVLLCCVLGGLSGIICRDAMGDANTLSSTAIHGHVPASEAHIVRYQLGKAVPGSGNETGNLHIFYSDGTEVTGRIAGKPAPSSDSIFNPVGIDDIKEATDKRTVGWEEMSTNCCESSSIPESLAIYRSGKSVLHIQQGQMIWHWNFLDGGHRVAVVWGPAHGTDLGYFQLIDTTSGHLIAEAYDNAKLHKLAQDAPQWAKQAEQEMDQK